MVMTGQEIYDNFHKYAVGTAQWQAAHDAASEMADEFPDQAAQIKRLQDELASAWTGSAADAAQHGMNPLALEHLNIADDLRTAQDLMARQVGSFHDAANAVRQMPPEPTIQDPLAAIAFGQPLDPMLGQAIRYDAVAQHNVDVMTTYDGASRYNATTMPTAYGTLADNPTTITLPPTPSTSAATEPGKSHTVRPATANRVVPATGQPAAPTGSAGNGGNAGNGAPAPVPPSGVGAVAPGASTTTSGSVPTGGAVTTPPANDGAHAEPVAEPPLAGGGDANPIPVAGHAIDAGPVGRGGLDALGGGAIGEPVAGGDPASRGTRSGAGGPGRSGGGSGRSSGVVTEPDAMAAGQGERAAEVPGGLSPAVQRGDTDDEHHRKYPLGIDADEVFAGGLPRLAPEALGETPQERAVRHAREAEGGH